MSDSVVEGDKGVLDSLRVIEVAVSERLLRDALDLPRSVMIVGARFEPEFTTVVVTLEHPKFQEISEVEKPPMVTPQVRTETTFWLFPAKAFDPDELTDEEKEMISETGGFEEGMVRL